MSGSAFDIKHLEQGVYTQLTSNLGRVVAPNAGPMTGSGTNTYVISEDVKTAGICLIDPGPAIPEHITNLLNLFGERIQSIVVTHTHGDHSPAAYELAQKTGATLLGCEAEKAALFQDETFSADVEVEDGQLLMLQGVAVRAIHTPGHVANHYCYFLERDQVLLTGDHLMNGSTVVIIPPAGVMKHYIESLQKLKSYPISFLAPGHGEMMGNPEEVIDWTIAHRLQREQKVFEKLQALGPCSLQGLTPAVYDDVDKSLHTMASYSLHAHLIKLQMDGRVRCVSEGDENSVVQWKITL